MLTPYEVYVYVYTVCVPCISIIEAIVSLLTAGSAKQWRSARCLFLVLAYHTKMTVTIGAASGNVTLESAMTRLKKLVYKNRLRLKDWLVDFDPLRKGEIHPNQFTRGMAMAGVDKYLSAKELQVICDAYTVPKTASMDVMQYHRFLADVDLIFTKPVSIRAAGMWQQAAAAAAAASSGRPIPAADPAGHQPICRHTT
jgi:hypothetical protein